MNERSLIAFMTVARTGSFAKAADELYCSNVTVMNQINALEKELGTKVFVRSNHGTDLTDSGSIFYEDVLNFYNYYKNTINKIRNASTVRKKKIRVGTSILRPCGKLTEMWRQTSELNTDFDVRIVSFNDDFATLNSIFNDESGIDCYIGPYDSSLVRDKYDARLLEWLPCRIAVPKIHPLSGKERITWKDLDNGSLIVMKNGLSSTIRKLNNRIIENPLRKLRDDILENHALIDIIDAGKFYSLDTFNMCADMNCAMESLDIWKNMHPGLVTLPADWDYACPYGIIFAKYASQDVLDFVDTVLKNYKTGELAV